MPTLEVGGNNEDDGANKLRLDELVYVRKVLAYSMRVKTKDGNAMWRQACQKIKHSRNGLYPSDWGAKILTFYDCNPVPHVELSEICDTDDETKVIGEIGQVLVSATYPYNDNVDTEAQAPGLKDWIAETMLPFEAESVREALPLPH